MKKQKVDISAHIISEEHSFAPMLPKYFLGREDLNPNSR